MSTSRITQQRIEHNLVLPGLNSIALAEARTARYVFPVAPYAKTPHPDVSSWASWATCDPREIRRNWPEDGANVGIACKPSGLLIVDTDDHGGANGIGGYRQLCEQNEPDGDYPDTRIVETPTGGLHHYYRNPDPDRYGNGRGGLPGGIDVRGGRGDGGYVLAVGSVLDRRAYKGKPELQAIVGDGKTYQVYNDAEVIEPPGWLTELLDAGPPARGGGGIKRPLWSVKVENPLTLKKRLDGAVQKLRDEAEGNRNELLFWVACTVGEAVAANRVDREEAEADLMDAMQQNGYLSGHDEYTARGTIRSGFMTVGAL